MLLPKTIINYEVQVLEDGKEIDVLEFPDRDSAVSFAEETNDYESGVSARVIKITIVKELDQ